MAENNEGWEVWAERLPDVETKQELPEGVWEDYKKYQMLNNREGDWSAPEMKNPDALTKIRNLMGKVKDLPDTMSYYAHKVADPMYANVDYMGQQVGDWAAKKINNIARAFDVSPEARQYGRFEEEEYDPEAVDVRFGRNAYKEGYDNLGDYLEAKDQEKVDRYRGYNHANRFAPIENADDKFYTLSDTQTMEDWQPETTSGKIAKGAIETAGNMLPENLKALMEEKGIEGGAKMLGALAPFYKKMKDEKEAANFWNKRGEAELRADRPVNADYDFADARKYKEGVRSAIDEKLRALKSERHRRYDLEHADNMVESNAKRIMEELKKQLTPEEYQALLQDRYSDVLLQDALNPATRGRTIERLKYRVGDRIPVQPIEDPATLKSLDRHRYSGVNGRKIKRLDKAADDVLSEMKSSTDFDEVRRMRDKVFDLSEEAGRLDYNNTPKPLPNPAAQRAEALRRNSSINVADDFRDFRDYQKELAEHYRIRANVNNDAERRMMNRFSQQALDNIDAINSELGDSRLIQGANEVLNSDKDLARAYSKLSSEEKRNAIKDAFKKLREGTYDGVPDPANPLKSALSEEVYSRIDEYGFPY